MQKKQPGGKIGFIGLGAMGQLMARRLLEAGYALLVYGRPQALETIVKRGAESESPGKEVILPKKEAGRKPKDL